MNIVPTDYCDATIALAKKIGNSFMELAMRLHNIRSRALWQDSWDSWEEFVCHLDISQATASKLIKVYEHYVIDHGIEKSVLADAPWSNLYELMPTATTKELAVGAVEKSKLLRREEVREEAREAKHGKCNHEDEFEVHIMQCRRCGARRSLV